MRDVPPHPQGDTYEKVNETAEKRWHLERARIIVSIENEMTAEKRLRVKRQYATVIKDKPFLQVCRPLWMRYRHNGRLHVTEPSAAVTVVSQHCSCGTFLCIHVLLWSGLVWPSPGRL